MLIAYLLSTHLNNRTRYETSSSKNMVLALSQIASGLACFILIHYLHGLYFSLIDLYISFQIASGLSLVIIAHNFSKASVPLAAYITVYILFISPFFLYGLSGHIFLGLFDMEKAEMCAQVSEEYGGMDPGCANLFASGRSTVIEYLTLFAISLFGLVTTTIFFLKFLLNPRMLPWLTFKWLALKNRDID